MSFYQDTSASQISRSAIPCLQATREIQHAATAAGWPWIRENGHPDVNMEAVLQIQMLNFHRLRNPEGCGCSCAEPATQQVHTQRN